MLISIAAGKATKSECSAITCCRERVHARGMRREFLLPREDERILQIEVEKKQVILETLSIHKGDRA